MQIYLVGGAVRDQLLGYPVKEHDWVVVGGTPEQMFAQGFKQVGKDFPVFLHPQTGDEYALARTERKTGSGYTGFSFHAAPDVSLADDLCRRDLSINAMAQTSEGEIIDPYGGQQDLQQRILRHVSPAFIEDPVRILRVARFLARYHDYGFRVADDTMQLMQQMVQQGEVGALTAERVWQELQRALSHTHAGEFFKCLAACGALQILFPALSGDEQALFVLDHVCALNEASLPRFAALFAATSLDLAGIKQLAKDYRIPKEYLQLTLLAKQHSEHYPQVRQLSAEEVLIVLEKLDSFRQFERFLMALQVMQALHLSSDKQHSDDWLRAYKIAAAVAIQPIIQAGFTGQAIRDELHRRRVVALAEML